MFPFKLTPKRVEYLKELELTSPSEVISYFPRTYNLYHQSVLDKENDQKRVVVKGMVHKKERVVRFGRNHTLFKFTLVYDYETYTVVCFNRDYLTKTISTGDEVIVVGKFDYYKREINMTELITNGIDNLKIRPLYSLPEGITNYEFQLLLKLCFNVAPIEEVIPESLRSKYRLVSRKKAYNDVHFPNDEEELRQALRYLKYEELLVYSLQLQLLKKEQKNAERSIAKKVDHELLERVISNSSFILTSDQEKAVSDIVKDLESNSLMYRMLQGDVGSGKTLVATMGLVANYSAGYQGVLMAPTDILARQHYAFLVDFLKDTPIKVGLLVSALSAKEKREVLEKMANHDYDIIVGTHALIQSGVEYAKLGLAVIDEQHRFGVKQRQLLKEKDENVELLMMSATPIPRSLAITLYGDMDISTIHSFPNQKRRVETRVIEGSTIKSLLKEITERVGNNERVFIVCPLIDEDENRRNVSEVYEGLKKHFQGKANVAFLHGRMGELEKEQTMIDFRDGKTSILVSTTVIEVGIDIRQATMMIIYDAESFGLATIHQLRGRIGRGGQEARCYLLCSNGSPIALKRLNYLVDHDDGFDIARFDLANRGPGDIVGTRQSGIPDLNIADIYSDLKILEVARDDAQRLIEQQDLEENKQIFAYIASKKDQFMLHLKRKGVDNYD